MNIKFQNKYRIPSARAVWWDYSKNGAYFVTICTKNRLCYFGDVVDGAMQLSEMGIVAEEICKEIENQFEFAELGEFVVMPNHVHLIVIINHVLKTPIVETPIVEMPIVETPLMASVQGGFAGNKNPMLNENLSRIIRWYKGRCTFELRKIHANFEWQSRFHDHIIRNEQEYQKIKSYIINNPKKWSKDKFYFNE